MLADCGLLLVTQHYLFRECLLSALRARIPGLPLSHADTPAQARDECRLRNYSLVVFDVDPPNDVPPPMARSFVRDFDGTRVMIVGRCESEATAMSYLEAGACDFRFTNAESLDEFCDAIDNAIRGEMCHSPERTQALFARLQELSDEVARIKSIDSLVLTDREMEILRLIDEGKSNKQIAKLLHISLHTVKNHVHRILDKLQVTNRREAVHLAYSNGWLKVETA